MKTMESQSIEAREASFLFLISDMKEQSKIYKLENYALKASQGDIITLGNLKFIKEKKDRNSFRDINLGGCYIKDALLSDGSDNYIITVCERDSSKEYLYLVKKESNGTYKRGCGFSKLGISDGCNRNCGDRIPECENDGKGKFIQLIDERNREECVMTTSFKVVGIDTNNFDLLDFGVRIVNAIDGYAYRYSRRSGSTRIYNVFGDLVVEIPFKVVKFFHDSNLCMVKYVNGIQKLFSIKDKRILDSDPLLLPIYGREGGCLPEYVNEWGYFEKDKTAFLTRETFKLAVFDLITNLLVKYVDKPSENFTAQTRIVDNNIVGLDSWDYTTKPTIASGIWIVKNDKNLFNIKCGNTLVSEDWFDDYELYDSQGSKIDKKCDYHRAALIKCTIDTDFDYFEIVQRRYTNYWEQSKKDTSRYWKWRFGEFGKVKPETDEE